MQRCPQLKFPSNSDPNSLGPLAADPEDWRAACGRPATGLVFPRSDGEPWTEHDCGNWPAAFLRPLTPARPYDLWHTFASC